MFVCLCADQAFCRNEAGGDGDKERWEQAGNDNKHQRKNKEMTKQKSSNQPVQRRDTPRLNAAQEQSCRVCGGKLERANSWGADAMWSSQRGRFHPRLANEDVGFLNTRPYWYSLSHCVRTRPGQEGTGALAWEESGVYSRQP